MLARSILRQGSSSSGGRLLGRPRQMLVSRRNMGGGGGPSVPEGYDKLGQFCLVSAFFWIMYRAKENKGQLFGLYAPWLHEHDHAHLHYAQDGDEGDTMPTLEQAEEDE